MKPRRVWLLVALPLLASSTEASASPAFPGVVRETLALGSAPQCTLCHSTPSGGLGTATTGFATYLRSRGLKAGDTGALRTALQAMIAEKHDTDGDGVPDADELKNGTDPGGTVDASVPPVEYGCGGAHVAPRGAPSSRGAIGALALALALGAALVRRRA